MQAMHRNDIVRVRRIQIIFMGGVTSVVYLLNGAAMMFATENEIQFEMLASQQAMKNCFHALLVLGVAGLYASQRKRIWFYMAFVYIPLTTLACGGCLSRHHNSILSFCVLFSQMLCYSFFGVVILRFKNLSAPGDDDFNLLQTFFFKEIPGHFNKFCLIFSSFCQLSTVILEVVTPWFYFDQNSDPFCCSVRGIEVSAHHAVVISFGAFALSNKSRSIRQLYAATAIVIGISRIQPISLVGVSYILSGIALLPVVISSPSLIENTTCDCKDTHSSSQSLSQLCCVYIHGISWWCEALYLPISTIHSHDSFLITLFTQSSVSGAHAAVLMGLQSYRSSSSNALMRTNFHIVVGIMYSFTALVGLISTVSRQKVSVVLIGTSTARLLSMSCLVYLNISECWSRRHHNVTDSIVSEQTDEEELVQNNEENECEYSTVLKKERVCGVPLTVLQSVVCVLVILITLNICLIAIADQLGLFTTNTDTTTHSGHTPASAITFHFGFLFSVHTGAAALYFRRISLSFVLHGTPFIFLILCIIVWKIPAVIGLFFPLLLLVFSNGVALLGIQTIIKSSLHHYPDGNVSWE